MRTVPSGWGPAWDCHIHVYEPGYALAPTATFKPPHAPASAYREVQQRLGLSRAVVVQPTGYGYDNSCTLSAMAQLGPHSRGIAVIRPDVPDEELQRLHAAGIRGVRFMMLAGGVLGWDALDTIAARIAPLGWLVNLQLDGRDLPHHEKALHKLPCRLVVDHIGKFLGPVTLDAESVRCLHRLLDGGRTWLKIAAPYETSRVGPPGYHDVRPLASALAMAHPQHCIWASNWPHPNIVPTPSEGDLLEWAASVVGDGSALRAMLVDNPAQLYA